MKEREARLLEKLTRSPREILFLDDHHIELLHAADEPARKRLRLAAFGGSAADRIAASIALAHLADAQAADALRRLLAAGDLARDVVSRLLDLGGSYAPYAGIVDPWLLQALSSTDEEIRRDAANTCGKFRIRQAGPLLLHLERSETSRRFAARHLLGAARAWPSRDVAVEIERWWKVGDERGQLMEAYAELAAHAPAGVYEGPLRRCAELLAEQSHDGTMARLLAAALEKRGVESRPLLGKIVRKSRYSTARQIGLETLYRIDPESADRQAHRVWKKCPAGAIRVWGNRYAGSGDAKTAALVKRAGDHTSSHIRLDALKALARIGGPEAAAAARDLAAGTDDLEAARLAAAVGQPELAQRVASVMARLGLVGQEDADAALAAIEQVKQPMTGLQIVSRIFGHAGLRVSFDVESAEPTPRYDWLAGEFAAVSGVVVDEATQTETPDDLAFVLSVNGHRHEWQPDNYGDWYDMITVGEIIEELAPGGPDPREFFQLDPHNDDQIIEYVLADPRLLHQLAQETGINLPVL